MTPQDGHPARHIVAVDAGTTMVKAALFDETGLVQLVGNVPLRLGEGSPLQPRLVTSTLAKGGTPATADYVNGGHNWAVWRILLRDFLTRVAFWPLTYAP